MILLCADDNLLFQRMGTKELDNVYKTQVCRSLNLDPPLRLRRARELWLSRQPCTGRVEPTRGSVAAARETRESDRSGALCSAPLRTVTATALAAPPRNTLHTAHASSQRSSSNNDNDDDSDNKVGNCGKFGVTRGSKCTESFVSLLVTFLRDFRA